MKIKVMPRVGGKNKKKAQGFLSNNSKMTPGWYILRPFSNKRENLCKRNWAPTSRHEMFREKSKSQDAGSFPWVPKSQIPTRSNLPKAIEFPYQKPSFSFRQKSRDDVGFPSARCEYILLLLVSKEAVLASDLTQQSQKEISTEIQRVGSSERHDIAAVQRDTMQLPKKRDALEIYQQTTDSWQHAEEKGTNLRSKTELIG